MSSIFEILDLRRETLMDWVQIQYDDTIKKIFKLDKELEGDLQIAIRIYKEAEIKSLRAKAKYYDGVREDLRLGKPFHDIVENYKENDEKTGYMDTRK